MSQDPELIGSFDGATFASIGADPQQFNAYSYVTNRPTTLIDPTGRLSCVRLSCASKTPFIGASASSGIPFGVDITLNLTSGNSSAVDAETETGNQDPALSGGHGDWVQGIEFLLGATGIKAIWTAGRAVAGWAVGRSAAKNAADDFVSGASGMLRDAAKGKGNFGIGSATRSQADEVGRAWVGPNYKVASDGKTLVSQDGLRQYRPPSFKPRQGKVEANLEQRPAGQKAWQSNAHINIVD
jgi:hypothetical protein